MKINVAILVILIIVLIFVVSDYSVTKDLQRQIERQQNSKESDAVWQARMWKQWEEESSKREQETLSRLNKCEQANERKK